MSKTKEMFMDVVQAGFDPDYDYADDEYFQEQEQDEPAYTFWDRVDDAWDREKERRMGMWDED